MSKNDTRQVAFM